MEIKNINFGSFVKLCFFIALSFGVVVGLVMFIMSLFGGNVYCNLGSIHITGILAGIINIFLFPVFISIIGILYSLIAYLPFKLILTYFVKGIKINGIFNIIEKDNY